jgi:hypothetical protein
MVESRSDKEVVVTYFEVSRQFDAIMECVMELTDRRSRKELPLPREVAVLWTLTVCRAMEEEDDDDDRDEAPCLNRKPRLTEMCCSLTKTRLWTRRRKRARIFSPITLWNSQSFLSCSCLVFELKLCLQQNYVSLAMVKKESNAKKKKTTTTKKKN